MRSLAALIALAACSSQPTGDGDWMASLPDTLSLAALTIPGTHDSGALHEPAAGLAKTQTLTFAEQLDAGVRYFDVRCRNFDDQFLIYHGSIDQDQTFDDVLAAMYAFLDAHPHEVLIVSVKEELAPQGATLTFEQLFAQYAARDPARWYLADAIPALGDARGKLVLLRRFDATASVGIAAAPAVWTDNATFDIAGPPVLHVEDNYIVTDDALKWNAITSLFGEATSLNDPAALYLAYTSGYQMISGLPNIPSVSDTINAMLDSYFATAPTARYGVVVMDFATAARTHAVLSKN
ncbi:MAG TPA: phosphatidylinositol-specific phospholipase C [Kofleriaceae bacterium]|nr:phosphatidylinositol-specific phospholipase C [Kofleriaceae bacterium]